MSSNLPVKRNERFFEKIKIYVKKILGKQEFEIVSTNLYEKVEIKNDMEPTFKQDIQVDKNELANKEKEQNKELEREEMFMKYTESPEMISSLSDKMLDQLLAYGEDLLEKEKKKVS